MAGVARTCAGLETVSYVLLCSGRGGLMGGDNDVGALLMPPGITPVK